MASSLNQAEFVYRSGTPPELYTFTIVRNQAGRLAVRDIQNPYGFVISPYTQIPQSVSDDIALAMQQVESILSSTSPINGSLVFANEQEKTFFFPTPMPNSNYRVVTSLDTFVGVRVSSKSAVSFTIQATAPFSGVVGFDIFV
jgi:hypothetical protein